MAVGSQATTLSDRAFMKDVSKQLAEAGLESALNAFASNAFGTWTHPSPNVATAILTFPSAHYGTGGADTKAYVRVENFRQIDLSTNRAAVWNFYTTYNTNDIIWYQGVWYRCKQTANNTHLPSDTFFWTCVPGAWSPLATYYPESIVLAGGAGYRCLVKNINHDPLVASPYWTTQVTSPWNEVTNYPADAIVLLGGTAYRALLSNSNHRPPDSTYWLSPPIIFSEGVVSYPNSNTPSINTQLQALVAPGSLFPNVMGAGITVQINSTGMVDSYNSCIAPYGTYFDNQAESFSAVVAGMHNSGRGVSLMSTPIIKGYVAANSRPTAPYSPRWTYDLGATVTGYPAVLGVVNQNRISRSPYVPSFNPMISLPTGEPFDESSTSLGFPTDTAPRIYTKSLGLYLDNATQKITVDGPVIMVISGPLHIDHGQIIVGPNGSLEIFLTGQFTNGVDGSSMGGIVNLTRDPLNPDPTRLLIVGTNTNLSLSGGNQMCSHLPFCGVIYMPSAALNVNNGGTDIYGALSAQYVIFDGAGTVSMHYDTTLRVSGTIGHLTDAPFLVSEIRELSDPASRVSLY
ncbi:MAG: Carbohydrate binding protein [Verrucomicrobia bacterium]|nr:Carbohydrate binding protein [Verrucomicrobiota bacterium]